MRAGDALGAAKHREAGDEELIGQGAGGVDHRGGVGRPRDSPVEHCLSQRGGLTGIEVRGEARVGDRFEALRQFGVVGHQEQPSGGAAQAFVRAHRHQVSPLVERVRPGLVSDQTPKVGSIK